MLLRDSVLMFLQCVLFWFFFIVWLCTFMYEDTYLIVVALFQWNFFAMMIPMKV